MIYRPEIDGLRAIAVLAVLLFHLNPAWLPGGFAGVDVFFVISGFLITRIIHDRCESGSFSLLEFYQRRIARIFPASLLVAMVTLFAASQIYTDQDLAAAGANFAASLLSVANLKLMLQGSYFELSPDAQPFLHYWSLSVEEQFYLVFPLLLLVLHRVGRRFLLPVLLLGCLASLIACAWIYTARPVWAFYLLPTRAWELGAGAALAIVTSNKASGERRLMPSLRALSLIGVITSFLILGEKNGGFPWPGAILPVVATLGLLLPAHPLRRDLVVQGLAHPILAGIGRRSFSLYLWHWPVFALVDYASLLGAPWQRLALKLVLTLVLTECTYRWVESPGRRLLNVRRQRAVAYGGLVASLALLVPFGAWVRKENYINASDARDGALVFNSEGKRGSMLLVGDSNGSMYGKAVKELAMDLDYRLTVISVAAGDPLPPASGDPRLLWVDTLAAVTREKPDVLILACSWESKLDREGIRLRRAVEALQPLTKQLVLLTQPPSLPPEASRQALREGSRPPFFEEPEAKQRREFANDQVRGLQGGNVNVLDVGPLLQEPTGEVAVLSHDQRPLYHDQGHLSGEGADRIKAPLGALVIRK